MRFLGLLFVLLCSSVVSAQDPVTISSTGNSMYPNEPSVAIVKKEPIQLIAAANINFSYYSDDKGQSWSEKPIFSSLGIWGDPVLHSDRKGRVYLAHLSRTKGKTVKYGFIDRIVVQTSSTGGQTFSAGVGVGLNGDRMQDKPWISTDDYSDEYLDRVYLSWTEFDKINSSKKKHKSRIRFSYSTDYGQSFAEAITVSDSVGDAKDDDHSLEGATTSSDRNGNLYMVWAGHHKLYFDKSSNGGKTWGKDKVIASQTSGWVMDIDHVWRSNGMPFVLTDNSKGPYDGRIYVVYGDDFHGDADVFIIHSDDQGESWSQPMRVHNDQISNGADQYLPNFAIDQTNGTIYVVYLDRRNSNFNVFNTTYLSVSQNGGQSFDDHYLQHEFSAPHGNSVFSGDYIDVDAHQGFFASVWTEMKDKSSIVGSFGSLKELDSSELIYPYGKHAHYFDRSNKKDELLYLKWTELVEGKVYLTRSRWFRDATVQEFDLSVLATRSTQKAGSFEYVLSTGKKRKKKIELRIKGASGEQEVYKY